jgi:hypothetical protein
MCINCIFFNIQLSLLRNRKEYLRRFLWMVMANGRFITSKHGCNYVTNQGQQTDSWKENCVGEWSGVDLFHPFLVWSAFFSVSNMRGELCWCRSQQFVPKTSKIQQELTYLAKLHKCQMCSFAVGCMLNCRQCAICR